MGIFSLVYSVWNSLFAILRWLRRLTASPKPAVEGNKVDKPTEGATEQKSPEWLTEKALFLGMPVSEKRVHYKCGFNYVTLNDIQTWTEYFNDNKEWLQKLAIGRLDEVCDIDPELNEKISIWRGDITTLEVDAIVNAANERLLGGGGVDGAIHKAAGEMLRNECATLNGCKVGEAKVSGGYQLPAKYVIHTVGPRGSGDEELMNCYQNSLNIMKELQQRSVAFPCISTGIYGFPNERAANIALKTARKFLQENRDVVDRIIFCLFMPVDVEMYEVLMQKYFPVCQPPPERTHVKETEPEALPSEEKTTVPIPDDETVKETQPGVTVIKTESKEEPAECQPLIKQVDEQKETNQAGGQGHSEEADKAVSDKSVSDKTVSDKTVSDKTVSDRAVSDKAVSDKAVSDKTVSDRAVADRAVSDKAVSDKAVSDGAVSDRAVADRAVSDRAVSDRAVADRAVSDKAVSDKAVSDKAVSDKAVSDGAVSDRAVADRAVSDRAVSDKAVSDKAVSDKAVSDKAVSDKAVADRPVADRAAADRAAADRAAADRAAADRAVSDRAVSDKAVADAVKQATENGLEISNKTESLKSDEKRMSTLNTETHSEPGTAEQNVSGADVGDMEVKPAEEITKTDETEQTLDVSSEHKVTEPDPRSHNQENDTLRTEHSIDKDKETTPATAEEHKRPSDKHEGSNVEGMEPGTGEQSNITVTDKEEENHSLVSNVTDSEQIALSQAQNQTTESKSSEEQHVKTDKNENLPPQAITESKM